MKRREGEVSATLSKDWQIKNNVRIPKGTVLSVSAMIESQLEKARMIENRERTVKTENKEK